MSTELFFGALLYAWIGGLVESTSYREIHEKLDWHWIDRQEKARAVVFSTILGLLWPGTLTLAAMSHFPGPRQWMAAFIAWRQPENLVPATPKNSRPNDQ